jgi:hypothetical protein
MFSQYSLLITIGTVVVLYIALYILLYTFFLGRVNTEERALLLIFLRKISKVPALIEVMRSHVVKSEAFDPLICVHTESMVESNNSLYDILVHNARVQNEFAFLMQLSAHSKTLQKHEYFIYIRDFILSYDRDMKTRFSSMNKAIRLWNTFIRIKNMTGIGWFLPGKEMVEVV